MADEQEEPGMLSSIPETDPQEIERILTGRISQIHYATIGKVAVEWAYFEAMVDEWLHILADVDTEIGVCFTGQMIGIRPRLDAYIALARHLGLSVRWNKR